MITHNLTHCSSDKASKSYNTNLHSHHIMLSKLYPYRRMCHQKCEEGTTKHADITTLPKSFLKQKIMNKREINCKNKLYTKSNKV